MCGWVDDDAAGAPRWTSGSADQPQLAVGDFVQQMDARHQDAAQEEKLGVLEALDGVWEVAG